MSFALPIPANQHFATMQWLLEDGRPVVRLLDQTRLPTETVYQDCRDGDTVRQAIRTLAVRGAPAIGVTAAYGIAQELLLALQAGMTAGQFDDVLAKSCADYAATRPTAVNLFWAIERMRAHGQASAGQPMATRVQDLVDQASAIHFDDVQCCLDMGRHGAPLLPDRGGVLTHCNTGGLATGGHGTGLGVVRSALALGKDLHVWIDETRPLLQGSRLTAWECAQDGIPSTLICDNMAGWVMKLGKVQAAIVGADRIAANGDSANKIGTYSVAVLCARHNIPFYVAAPTSTIDLDCPTGEQIPIEERSPDEVTTPRGVQFAASGVGVFNPAFDVAPAELIAAIITEEGVARAPFASDLKRFVAQAQRRRAGHL
jgi:methylthioribose-1-phosphate isomerase